MDLKKKDFLAHTSTGRMVLKMPALHLVPAPASAITTKHPLTAYDAIDYIAGQLLFCLGKYGKLKQIAQYFLGYACPGEGIGSEDCPVAYNAISAADARETGATSLAYGLSLNHASHQWRLFIPEAQPNRCRFGQHFMNKVACEHITRTHHARPAIHSLDHSFKPIQGCSHYA